MRRILLISLALVLLSPNAVFGASVKNGATCKKLGQEIKQGTATYRCVKEGKKLLWRVSKSSPIPVTVTPATPVVPNPPIKPDVIKTNFFTNNLWSTTPTRQQLIDSALLEIKQWAAGRSVSGARYDIYFDNQILESDKVWIKRVLDFATDAFGEYHPGRLRVFVTLSDEWAAAKAGEFGIKFSGDPRYICGSQTTWENYCAGTNWAALILAGRYREFPNVKEIPWPAQVRAVVAHEYFHSVQKNQYADPSNASPLVDKRVAPKWLHEGSANFIGAAIANYLGLIDYEQMRLSEVDNHPDYQGAPGSRPLKDFYNNWRGDPQGYLNPYGIGQVATEYIVANVGLTGLLNIFKYAGEAENYDVGFKRATGISIEEFYEKFDAMRGRVGLPAVRVP